MGSRLEIDVAGLEAELEQEFRRSERLAMRVLDRMGAQIVAHLQSYVGTKEDGRPVHPGGWADLSENLKEGFGHEVKLGRDGPELVIFNAANHAHLVEARDGLFVVSGVLESDMARREMARAIQQVAPAWEFV